MVQVAGGLVGQQHPGLVDEGPGDGDALALAAAELRGAVLHAVGQAHLIQQPLRALGDLFFSPHPARHAALQHGGDGDVFQRRKLGQQVIELEHEAHRVVAVAVERPPAPLINVLPVVEHGARVGPVQPAEQVQQGGLAAARPAQDRQQLAGTDFAVHAPQHAQVGAAHAVGLLDAGGVQDGGGSGHHGFPSATRNAAHPPA